MTENDFREILTNNKNQITIFSEMAEQNFKKNTNWNAKTEALINLEKHILPKNKSTIKLESNNQYDITSKMESLDIFRGKIKQLSISFKDNIKNMVDDKQIRVLPYDKIEEKRFLYKSNSEELAFLRFRGQNKPRISNKIHDDIYNKYDKNSIFTPADIETGRMKHTNIKENPFFLDSDARPSEFIYLDHKTYFYIKNSLYCLEENKIYFIRRFENPIIKLYAGCVVLYNKTIILDFITGKTIREYNIGNITACTDDMLGTRNGYLLYKNTRRKISNDAITGIQIFDKDLLLSCRDGFVYMIRYYVDLTSDGVILDESGGVYVSLFVNNKINTDGLTECDDTTNDIDNYITNNDSMYKDFEQHTLQSNYKKANINIDNKEDMATTQNNEQKINMINNVQYYKEFNIEEGIIHIKQYIKHDNQNIEDENIEILKHGNKQQVQYIEDVQIQESIDLHVNNYKRCQIEKDINKDLQLKFNNVIEVKNIKNIYKIITSSKFLEGIKIVNKKKNNLVFCKQNYNYASNANIIPTGALNCINHLKDNNHEITQNKYARGENETINNKESYLNPRDRNDYRKNFNSDVINTIYNNKVCNEENKKHNEVDLNKDITVESHHKDTNKNFRKTYIIYYNTNDMKEVDETFNPETKKHDLDHNTDKNQHTHTELLSHYFSKNHVFFHTSHGTTSVYIGPKPKKYQITATHFYFAIKNILYRLVIPAFYLSAGDCYIDGFFYTDNNGRRILCLASNDCIILISKNKTSRFYYENVSCMYNMDEYIFLCTLQGDIIVTKIDFMIFEMCRFKIKGRALGLLAVKKDLIYYIFVLGSFGTLSIFVYDKENEQNSRLYFEESLGKLYLSIAYDNLNMIYLGSASGMIESFSINDAIKTKTLKIKRIDSREECLSEIKTANNNKKQLVLNYIQEGSIIKLQHANNALFSVTDSHTLIYNKDNQTVVKTVHNGRIVGLFVQNKHVFTLGTDRMLKMWTVTGLKLISAVKIKIYEPRGIFLVDDDVICVYGMGYEFYRVKYNFNREKIYLEFIIR